MTNTNNIKMAMLALAPAQKSSQTVTKKTRGNICQDCHLPPHRTSLHPFSIYLTVLDLSIVFISFQLVAFYCIFAPFYRHYNPIVLLYNQQKSTCSLGNQTTALSVMKASVSLINGLEKTNIGPRMQEGEQKGNNPPPAQPLLATIECC